MPHGFWVPDHKADKSWGACLTGRVGATGASAVALLMGSVDFGRLRVHRDGTEADRLIDVLCPVEGHRGSLRELILHWVVIHAWPNLSSPLLVP